MEIYSFKFHTIGHFKLRFTDLLTHSYGALGAHTTFGSEANREKNWDRKYFLSSSGMLDFALSTTQLHRTLIASNRSTKDIDNGETIRI